YEYDLLVIPVPGEQREDYELQDLIESRCRSYARVNATVRNLDAIKDLLNKGSTFYETVFDKGYLLYRNEHVEMSFPLRPGTSVARMLKAEQDWNVLYCDAAKFLA